MSIAAFKVRIYILFGLLYVNMVTSHIPSLNVDWNSPKRVKEMNRFSRQVIINFNKPLCDINDDGKINYFLIWVGNEGQEFSETFVFQGEEKRNVDSYIYRNSKLSWSQGRIFGSSDTSYSNVVKRYVFIFLGNE